MPAGKFRMTVRYKLKGRGREGGLVAAKPPPSPPSPNIMNSLSFRPPARMTQSSRKGDHEVAAKLNL